MAMHRLARLGADHPGDDPIVKVITGATGSFWIHYPVLSARSTYLDRSLSEMQTKSDICALDLTQLHFNFHDFSKYVNWVYRNATRHISPTSSAEGSTALFHDLPYYDLMDLYFIGLELEDEEFQNAVLDAFLTRHQTEPQLLFHPNILSYVVKRVYARTEHGNKARKMLVAIFATDGSASVLEEMRTTLNTDFMVDVAVELLEGKDGKKGTATTNCDFHSHEEVEKCKASKKRKLR